MKKWIVLIISLLAVFAFAAAAQADDLTLIPQFDTEVPVQLWESVCFEIHSENDVRNEAVMFYFNEGELRTMKTIPIRSMSG